jgi:hypothetical protein
MQKKQQKTKKSEYANEIYIKERKRERAIFILTFFFSPSTPEKQFNQPIISLEPQKKKKLNKQNKRHYKYNRSSKDRTVFNKKKEEKEVVKTPYAMSK